MGNNSIDIGTGSKQPDRLHYIDRNLDLLKNVMFLLRAGGGSAGAAAYAAKSEGPGKLVVLDPAPARKYCLRGFWMQLILVKPNEVELSI